MQSNKETPDYTITEALQTITNLTLDLSDLNHQNITGNETVDYLYRALLEALHQALLFANEAIELYLNFVKDPNKSISEKMKNHLNTFASFMEEYKKIEVQESINEFSNTENEELYAQHKKKTCSYR